MRPLLQKRLNIGVKISIFFNRGSKSQRFETYGGKTSFKPSKFRKKKNAYFFL